MAGLVLKELKMTCDVCPSQWEGKTEDGKTVYILYRWGCLSAGVGATLDEAVDNAMGLHGGRPIVELEPDDCESEGEMSTEDMLRYQALYLRRHSMARVTSQDVDEVIPAIKEALLKAPVYGEVAIVVDQGRIERIEARPRIRTWHRGKKPD